MNLALRCLYIALAVVLPEAGAWATVYEVVARPNLEFAQHDGTRLAGDLYLPKGLEKPPVIVAIHGGGWQAGSRTSYKYWGPFMARNGYALFSIDYRLGKSGTFPGSAYDVKSAVQFVRAKGCEESLASPVAIPRGRWAGIPPMAPTAVIGTVRPRVGG